MLYNQDDYQFEVEEEAPYVDVAVDEAVIEHVELETISEDGRKSVNIQWARRFFHMASCVWPLLVIYLGIEAKTVLTYFWPVVALLVVPEFFRFRYPRFNNWYIRKFGKLMRPHEKHSMHTAAMFALTVYGGVALFGIQPMLAAFLCLSLGDPIAAIVGLKFGRIRVFGKTVEGSAACFAVCFGIMVWAFPGNYLLAGLAALTATLAELVPMPVNDNIRMPLLTAATITLVLLVQGMA